MTIAVSKVVTCSYHITEGRRVIDWFEHQVDDDIRRFVPIYQASDLVKARQFWKLAWDAPDLLGYPVEGKEKN